MSHAERNENTHDMYYGDDNEYIVILNSCDGALCNITNFCDNETLNQNTSIISPYAGINNKLNLTQWNNSLTILSNNGKEKMQALDYIFDDYFKLKKISKS